MMPKMLPRCNLAGVLGGLPKGQLFDQMRTMGQRPTVTLIGVPFSLRTLTDGRSPSMMEITLDGRTND